MGEIPKIGPGGASIPRKMVREPKAAVVSIPEGVAPPSPSLPRDRTLESFLDWLRTQPNNGGLVQGSLLPRKVWPLGPSGEEIADLHAMARAAGLLTRGAKKGEAGGVFLCIPGMESSAGAVQLKVPLPAIQKEAAAPIHSPYSLQSFIAHVHSVASEDGTCHGSLLPRKIWPTKASGHPYANLKELAQVAGFDVTYSDNRLRKGPMYVIVPTSPPSVGGGGGGEVLTVSTADKSKSIGGAKNHRASDPLGLPPPPTPVSAEVYWECQCGYDINMGPFCQECAFERPVEVRNGGGGVKER